MDFIKKFFNNATFLAVVAIAFIVAAVFINIDANAKLNFIKEENYMSDAAPPSASAAEEATFSGKSVKEIQEQELNTALYDLASLSDQKSNITGIIDRYIELRYNYTDGPDKKHILDELSGITTKSFLGTVDNSLNYQTGDSKAVVIKRYATIYSMNSMTAQSESTIDSFVYIVDINGVNKVISYTMFKESGKWALYAEKQIGTVGADEIQTDDLFIPDVVKAAEPSTAPTSPAQETQIKEVRDHEE